MKNIKLTSGALFLTALILIALQTTHAQQVKLDKYLNQEQTITGVRIASAAIIPKKWDKATNWDRVEKAVREASQEGDADVIVTPEGVLEGYVINEVNETTENKQEIVKKFKALAEPLDGIYIQKASALCKELGIYLVFGFLEMQGDQTLNSVILIDPDGDIIGKYSKTHFAQGYTINPTCYVAGDEYPVFDTPFGKVGMIICYDRQLPEPARIMALNGAQVLFVPAYGSYTDEAGWNTVLMRTRAYENNFPVVFCNPFQSLLIDEDGDLRAFGKANEIVYYNINTSPRRYEGRFKNRRPQTYGRMTEQ